MAESAAEPPPSSSSCAAHLLPCKIDFDGPAPVASYFLQEGHAAAGQPADPLGPLAQFRGRELRGREVHLPAGVQARCVSRAGRVLGLEGQVSQLMVWQHDAAPAPAVMGDYLAAIEVAQAVSLVE